MDHVAKNLKKGKCVTWIGQDLSAINALLHCLVGEDEEEKEGEANGEEGGRGPTILVCKGGHSEQQHKIYSRFS